MNISFLKENKNKGLIYLLVGVLVLLLIFPTSSSDTITENSKVAMEEGELERQLKKVLSAMEGVGEVEVMITQESSSELVLQVDEKKTEDILREEDGEGGVKDSTQSEYTKETVLIGTADGPYVIKEINPQVSGVLILVRGAGSAAVKNEICEAVEALFNLPIHKIKVLEAE